MAKMFYTIEEVCQKLAKSTDEVNEMVSSGQIQEFRDGEKLIFKVEQIDLLVDPEDSGSIELDLSSQETPGMDPNADSNAGFASGEASAFDIDSPASSSAGASSTGRIDLTGSATGIPHEQPSAPASSPSMGSGTGSGLAFDLSGSASGVSAFGGGGDAGETQLGEDIDEDLTLESVGSGSGLLDLTRESDDTSLGAELLEEVYSGEDEFELPANASGLFEAVAPAEAGDPAAPAAAPAAAATPMMMVEEGYDGAGSGLGVGMSIGALVAMIVLLIILASEIEGTASGLTDAIAGSLWVWTGGLAVGAIIAGGIGLFIGRASE
ncbi:MAG: helix-turn-helix domain-containing protein [Planctomycetota bacterium]|nr:helix-turn-helix domain-containing protein [Planctomycetota bacterium]